MSHDLSCDKMVVICLQNLDVRFIEYMPFDGNKWSVNKFFPFQEMLALIKARWPNVQRVAEQPNDTSKVFGAHLFVQYRFNVS